MSGYLQRLAISAARPSQAVHPQVGGVFAREQRKEPRPEPIVAESSEVELLVERHDADFPGSQTKAFAGRREHPEIEPRVQPHTEPREQAETGVHDTSPSEERQTEQLLPTIQKPKASIMPLVGFVPLVAGWRQSTTPAQGRKENAGEKKVAARQERVGQNDVLLPISPSAEQSAGLELVSFAPNMKRSEDSAREALTASREAALKPVAAIPPAASRREEAKQQSRQSVSSSRGSEEIQIHIGRIEVIAVPQQTQRPTPAKTQRGESLQEYLKRHERRSR